MTENTVNVSDVSQELIYLTNACGEKTGYGSLDVTEEDCNLVNFDSGPGVALVYIAEIAGRKCLLANLEIAHQDEFWGGDSLKFKTEPEVRSYCNAAMDEIGSRLECGAFLVQLDEDMPGRLIIGLAIPLDSIKSQEHGHDMLQRMLGSYADADLEPLEEREAHR